MDKRGQLAVVGIVVLVIAVISAFVVFVPYDSFKTLDTSLTCWNSEIRQTKNNDVMFSTIEELGSNVDRSNDYLGCVLVSNDENIKTEYVCVDNKVTVICKAR